MRPRHEAVENLLARQQFFATTRSFNEATARGRGKPLSRVERGSEVTEASMRPRHEAVENKKRRCAPWWQPKLQ